MPRLGFAYQATDRFVLRGGYGATSFFEGNASNQRLTSITPFIQAVNVTTVTPTGPAIRVPRGPRSRAYRRHRDLWRYVQRLSAEYSAGVRAGMEASPVNTP